MMGMGFKRLLFVMVAMLLFLVIGCANEIRSEEQKVKVQKRVDDKSRYEDSKEVADKGQVKRVKGMLDKVDWEKAKVDMARPADYRFVFGRLVRNFNGRKAPIW